MVEPISELTFSKVAFAIVDAFKDEVIVDVVFRLVVITVFCVVDSINMVDTMKEEVIILVARKVEASMEEAFIIRDCTLDASIVLV
jgi:hypothetical protein